MRLWVCREVDVGEFRLLGLVDAVSWRLLDGEPLFLCTCRCLAIWACDFWNTRTSALVACLLSLNCAILYRQEFSWRAFLCLVAGVTARR